MCGICGYYNLKGAFSPDEGTLRRMIGRLGHRGPDDTGQCYNGAAALGFTRLSLVDLEGGNQPLANEDGTVVLVCNGEIYNYKELRSRLMAEGHTFKTKCDVEVILHLYETHGVDFLTRLNGQFAFALYDSVKGLLLCARDPCGIAPFYYTLSAGHFVFASEIKAILEHEAVEKEVDLTGLDQIMHFPGMASPRTLFRSIRSLEGGHYLLVTRDGGVRLAEYWDLIYPKAGEIREDRSEDDYIEELDGLLTEAVRCRMQADAPVGFYLSGGLDSSLIAAKIRETGCGEERHSFSIAFPDQSISEARFQQMMAERLRSIHHEIWFTPDQIAKRLGTAVYHSECALKETYNTASLALSEAVRSHGIKAVLTGEGADELFGGYVGYRFDQLRKSRQSPAASGLDMEARIRRELWGDEDFLYEKNHYAYQEETRRLYSREVNAVYDDIACLRQPLIKKERIEGVELFHKRSYIDFKLRMSDHLLSDHGDRMSLANSVEARYPFLDPRVIEFARTAPVTLKLKQYKEKYILKRAAEKYVPAEIINRPKFAFVAPGSPDLLKREKEFLGDLLSYETIRRQGIFNPDTVEALKKQYAEENFKLNLPYDNDMLIIVITFGLFLREFHM